MEIGSHVIKWTGSAPFGYSGECGVTFLFHALFSRVSAALLSSGHAE